MDKYNEEAIQKRINDVIANNLRLTSDSIGNPINKATIENTEVFLQDKFIRQELRNARASKHITQQELSKLSGLSIATISNIESGDGSPTLRSLIRYAKAVDYELKIKKS